MSGFEHPVARDTAGDFFFSRSETHSMIQVPRLTKIILAALLLAWLLGPAAAQAESILSGRVVGVHDGDTLTILDGSKRQVKIRLAEIDAPESGQPYGSRSKQELSGLAFGRPAAVQVQDIDRYGRTVGRITVDGVDVNAEMVRRGAAWVYRKYAKDQSLFSIEKQARDAKAGLWALPEADKMPPWEWRKMKKVRTSNHKAR